MKLVSKGQSSVPAGDSIFAREPGATCSVGESALHSSASKHVILLYSLIVNYLQSLIFNASESLFL